jgi:hypothetical protein
MTQQQNLTTAQETKLEEALRASKKTEALLGNAGNRLERLIARLKQRL